MRALASFSAAVVLAIPAFAQAPVEKALKVGDVAPAFGPLTVLNPKAAGVESVSFAGKPSKPSKALLLSFFATWCPGCVNETPLLAQLQKTYGDRGLQVVSLTIEKEPAAQEKARKLLEQHGATYVAAFDADERVRRMFQGRKFSLPSLYLIDASGKIVAWHEGFEKSTESKLKPEIERLLK
jgi:thiol-disulfide isomerase/thioredoxin